MPDKQIINITIAALWSKQKWNVLMAMNVHTTHRDSTATILWRNPYKLSGLCRSTTALTAGAGTYDASRYAS